MKTLKSKIRKTAFRDFSTWATLQDGVVSVRYSLGKSKSPVCFSFNQSDWPQMGGLSEGFLILSPSALLYARRKFFSSWEEESEYNPICSPIIDSWVKNIQDLIPDTKSSEVFVQFI